MFETLARPLPKKQISRLLFVDLAVILVLVIFPVRSGWIAYTNAKAALLEQQEYQSSYLTQLSEATRAERNRPTVVGEIRAASMMLSEGSQSLRSPGEVASILEEVRDLARRMSLDGVNVAPRNLNPQTGFQLHEMVISAVGTYKEHLNFIHALRNNSSLFMISSMSLRLETEDPRTPQLRMELGLQTVLVEDLIPLEEINRIVAEQSVGVPPDSTAVLPGGDDEGGSGSEGIDR
ncbi:hypothetical protein ACFL6T_05765 [Candidatus Zixiibacteriota bacterium]